MKQQELQDKSQIQQEQAKELERLSNRLKELDKLEPFRVWRDEIVKPILEQIDYKLRDVLEMDEATLKATIMYRNTINELFIKIFDDARIES